MDANLTLAIIVLLIGSVIDHHLDGRAEKAGMESAKRQRHSVMRMAFVSTVAFFVLSRSVIYSLILGPFIALVSKSRTAAIRQVGGQIREWRDRQEARSGNPQRRRTWFWVVFGVVAGLIMWLATILPGTLDQYRLYGKDPSGAYLESFIATVVYISAFLAIGLVSHLIRRGFVYLPTRLGRIYGQFRRHFRGRS